MLIMQNVIFSVLYLFFIVNKVNIAKMETVENPSIVQFPILSAVRTDKTRLT